MPHILVVDDDGYELHRERVEPVHLETEFSKSQIVERVGWVIEAASSLRHSAEGDQTS